MNVFAYQKKLLKALYAKHRFFAVNSYHVFSEEYQKTMRRYDLVEFVDTGNAHRKRVTVCSSYRQIDILLKLVEIYQGGDPSECQTEKMVQKA